MEKYFGNRIELANLPTPIGKLERFSEELNGPDIYIKRDDLTGLELSGNKVRKLEFILAEALKQKVNVIISCGNLQSNHLRSCAVAAAKLGIKAHMVVWGSKIDEVRGNHLLNCLSGAEFSYYEAVNTEDMNNYMQKVAEEYRIKGFNPLVIPLGANTPLGVLGYVHAVKELKEQLEKLESMPDYLVLAVGTGSTYLGILLGIRYYKLPIKLIGINVIDKDINYLETLRLEWKNFCDYFKFNEVFKLEEVEIKSDYLGSGYGMPQKEVSDVISRLAETEGIFLDSVYAGKAMYGLCEEIKKNRFKKNEKILFLHTGGIFELFR